MFNFIQNKVLNESIKITDNLNKLVQSIIQSKHLIDIKTLQNFNHQIIRIIDIDKSPYNIPNNMEGNYVTPDNRLIKTIFQYYEENPSIIIILRDNKKGNWLITSYNNNQEEKIKYITATYTVTNFTILKDEIIFNNPEIRDKLILKNLQYFKKELIIIFDEQTNKSYFKVFDQQQAMVGHSINYMKSNIQALSEEIEEIKGQI